MEAGECSSKLKTDSKPIVSLIDIVFSWSVENVLDEKLFKTQLKEIPLSFHSEDHYFESFKLPLLEDTRALLSSKLGAISRAPYAEVTYFERSTPHRDATYDVKVDYWRSNGGKINYRLSPGDLIVLTDAITEEVSCSDVGGRTWIFASVASVDEAKEDNGSRVSFTVKASSGIKSDCLVKNPLFVVFLANIATHERIWNALHMHGNMEIIKQVLRPEVKEDGSLVAVKHDCCSAEELDATLLSKLNESQTRAVLASLCNVHCNFTPSVKLVWGSPGTGKTYTLSTLLVVLSRMECRALVCAHSSIAIARTALHFLKLVKDSYGAETARDSLFPSLDNFLFFWG